MDAQDSFTTPFRLIFNFCRTIFMMGCLIAAYTWLAEPASAQQNPNNSTNDSIWEQKPNKDVFKKDIGGRVGIGTSTPAAKLHVIGDARIEGLSGDSTRLVGALPSGQLTTLSTAQIQQIIDFPGFGGNPNQGPPAPTCNLIDQPLITIWLEGKTNNSTYLCPNFNNLGLGTDHPVGRLHVEHATQSAFNGNAFILGDTTSTHLRMGNGQGYSWLQVRNGDPLVLNPLPMGDDNVGIGLTDPQKALHVYSKHGGLQVTGSHEGIRLEHEEFSGNNKLGNATWDIEPVLDPNEKRQSKLFFGIPNKTVMALEDTGNVGIGTTIPQARLHVAGAIRVPHQTDANISGQQTLLYNGGKQSGADTKDGFRIRWDPSSSIVNGQSADALIFEKTDASSNQSNPDGGIAFVNTNSNGTVKPALVIQGNGKVQVGTKTIVSGKYTNYLLSVDGTVVARKFVATHDNWGDDEFNKDLTLQDLKAEQQYVEQQQHLQGIPDETTIKKEGLDLSEMSEQQMRKIEQIYMYLFEFREENTQLKAENEQLRQRLQKLEQAVEKLKEQQ